MVLVYYRFGHSHIIVQVLLTTLYTYTSLMALYITSTSLVLSLNPFLIDPPLSCCRALYIHMYNCSWSTAPHNHFLFYQPCCNDLGFA